MADRCIALIDRLIEERRRQGMTQRELAEAASLTQPVIARFESKRAMPQLDTLLKITDALGCAIEIVRTEYEVE